MGDFYDNLMDASFLLNCENAWCLRRIGERVDVEGKALKY
jgi:hypothetical protein